MTIYRTKSILAPAALVGVSAIFLLGDAAAQAINPKKLEGRWMLVSSSPSLDAQTVEYTEFQGYDKSREKELKDEIRQMKKDKEPQLLVIDGNSMTFKGVEVFGGGCTFSFSIDGSKLMTKFAGSVAGTPKKMADFTPEFFTAKVSDTSLTLSAKSVKAMKGKAMRYKFTRYTKIEGETRKWTFGKREVDAKVVDYKKGIVYLEANGKVVKMSAKKLKGEDLEYFKGLIESSK